MSIIAPSPSSRPYIKPLETTGAAASSAPKKRPSFNIKRLLGGAEPQQAALSVRVRKERPVDLEPVELPDELKRLLEGAPDLASEGKSFLGNPRDLGGLEATLPQAIQRLILAHVDQSALEQLHLAVLQTTLDFAAQRVKRAQEDEEASAADFAEDESWGTITSIASRAKAAIFFFSAKPHLAGTAVFALGVLFDSMSSRRPNILDPIMKKAAQSLGRRLNEEELTRLKGAFLLLSLGITAAACAPLALPSFAAVPSLLMNLLNGGGPYSMIASGLAQYAIAEAMAKLEVQNTVHLVAGENLKKLQNEVASSVQSYKNMESISLVLVARLGEIYRSSSRR